MTGDNTLRRLRPGIEISTWPELKFARAVQHFRELQSRIEVWRATEPVSNDKVFSEDRRMVTVTLRIKSNPPIDDWALVLGDGLHNLRSALDALAWDLCHLDGGKPERPRRVYFPFATTEEDWDKIIARDLASIPHEILGRVRMVQPFLYPPEPVPALLLLADLDVQDKHRTSIKVTLRGGGINLDGARIEFEDETSIPDPPFKMRAAPNFQFRDNALLLEVSSSARMKSYDNPGAIQMEWLLAHNGVDLALNQALNVMIYQVRATLDLTYRGEDQPEAADDDQTGWTSFEPEFDQPV